MQINLQQIETAVLIVALILFFGTNRFVDFGHDLQKAWRDFRGLFPRRRTR